MINNNNNLKNVTNWATSSYNDNVIDAEYTIVEDVTKEDRKERVPYRTMVDVMNDGRLLPDKRKMYNDFWFENEICILFAEQGKGKTILAMQIAIQLSTIEKVLYLDYEMGDKQLFNRYRVNNEEFQFSENFIHPNDIFFEDNKENNIINYITNLCTVYDIKIVIIDNISALSHQLESSNSMVNMMNKLNKLKKELGLSILILGHTKKRKKTSPIEDNDLAGSKKIIALVDSAFAIGASINDEKQLYLKQIKVRECEMKYGSNNVMLCVVEKFDNHLHFIKTGYSTEEELLNKKGVAQNSEHLIMMIKKYQSTGLSNRQIAKKLEISEGTVRNYLKKIKLQEEEEELKSKKEESVLMDEEIYQQVTNIINNKQSNAHCYA